MAIKIDAQQTQIGVPVTGAYYRIIAAAIIRQAQEPKFVVMIDLVGYATSTPETTTQPIDVKRAHVPLEDIESQEGPGFLEKCYRWAMQQDGMEGSMQA